MYWTTTMVLTNLDEHLRAALWGQEDRVQRSIAFQAPARRRWKPNSEATATRKRTETIKIIDKLRDYEWTVSVDCFKSLFANSRALFIFHPFLPHQKRRSCPTNWIQSNCSNIERFLSLRETLKNAQSGFCENRLKLQFPGFVPETVITQPLVQCWWSSADN